MSEHSIDLLISPESEPITPEQSGVRLIPYDPRRRALIRSIVLGLPLFLAIALVVWLT